MGGRIRYRLESTSVAVEFQHNNARTAGVVVDYEVECCWAGGSSDMGLWLGICAPKDDITLSPPALCKRGISSHEA